MPETIDEFYEEMKAFTYDDPNQSGEDDTVGLVVSEYEGPWDTMQTWFGVPNEWGVDEDGTLYPHFEAPEYREALDFFKKLYDEGLVNEDFAVMDPSKWHDEFINGNAGMVVDVAEDRKSTRLNSSHVAISYAVFCLQKTIVYCACS